MPSPEAREGGQPAEHEPAPYYRAARFRDPAAQTYLEAQDVVYHEDCNLSTFRLQISTIWHVITLRQV